MMATEQASTVATETGSLPKWATWLAAVVGLWVLVSPFVLTGEIASGTAMWSNTLAGILIAILAGFGAYSLRSSTGTEANSPGEWSSWIAALTGLWILGSAYVLTGPITTGTVLWSNVASGVVAFVLAAYGGYALHGG